MCFFRLLATGVPPGAGRRHPQRGSGGDTAGDTADGGAAAAATAGLYANLTSMVRALNGFGKSFLKICRVLSRRRWRGFAVNAGLHAIIP